MLRDSPSTGGQQLRDAIGWRWGCCGGDAVIVTHGSSESLWLFLTAVLSPGDVVVTTEPGYHALAGLAAGLGCRLVSWRLEPSAGFRPDVDRLVSIIERVVPKAVIVNFPHNPTGATVSQEDVNAIVAACGAVDAVLLWDGAFGDLVYQGAPLRLPLGRPGVAMTGTLSKAYGLPGLRIGWCIAWPSVIDRMVELRDYVTLSHSPLTELLALGAVQHADRILEVHLEQARRNLGLLRTWMDEHGDRCSWTPPCAGVTAFIRLNGIGDTTTFCDRLLLQAGVLLVPGACFGHPAYVRLGFGGPEGELREGLQRMAEHDVGATLASPAGPPEPEQTAADATAGEASLAPTTSQMQRQCGEGVG
jgi:aspartate/methionine/tyrosine aminotransferase